MGIRWGRVMVFGAIVLSTSWAYHKWIRPSDQADELTPENANPSVAETPAAMSPQGDDTRSTLTAASDQRAAPPAGIDPDPKSATTIAALQATVQALTSLRTPTPSGPDSHIATELEAMQTKVASLTTQDPPSIATVIAAEGLPVDYPLPVVSVRASSTNSDIDANELPKWKPEFVADHNTGTWWFSGYGDGDNSWLDFTLDATHNISGVRFMTASDSTLPFKNAVLLFSDNTARKLHLTEAQTIKHGWLYFPIVPEVQASSVRIVIDEMQSICCAINYAWCGGCVAFSEIEIYGR